MMMSDRHSVGCVRQVPAVDIIFIRDLRVETVIGVYDWERQIKQIVSIELEMGADIHRAAQTDAIEDTLDYKAVAKRLIEFVGTSSFSLVETLGERIAEIVMNEFQVPWVRLGLSKPGAVSGSREVGIIIERGSRGAAADG
jgi:dihydroneopterin aldolase